jgi:predicted nucleic acid-binding protein
VSVLVDTSALYALLVRTEERRDEVEAALDRFLDEGRLLRTTSYVLVETVALLQHRFGLGAVRDLYSRVLPLMGVTWIDARLHGRAMERLIRADERGLSLVDVASFVVMEQEGIRTALTLDADFERHGFDVLPARRG